MAIQITAAMKCSSQALKETSNCTSSMLCAKHWPLKHMGLHQHIPSKHIPQPFPLHPFALDYGRKRDVKKYMWMDIGNFRMQWAQSKAVPASLPAGGTWRPPCLSPRAEGRWWRHTTRKEIFPHPLKCQMSLFRCVFCGFLKVMEMRPTPTASALSKQQR